MPRGTQGSVCPFRPPAPPKPIPRCLEQHRSVILHDSCDPEWSQRPHFLDSLKPHADVGLIDEKSGLILLHIVHGAGRAFAIGRPWPRPHLPWQNELTMTSRFLWALGVYAVLALMAAFTLDGNLRVAVWILLAGLTVKTCIAYKAGW